MDLAGIKPQIVKLDILHPGTGAATGLVIHLASSETEAVKRAQRKQIDRRLKNRDKKLTVEQLDAETLEILTASIVGWEWKGDAAWNGKKPEFTADAVADVLSVDWLRKQVKDAFDEDAGFFTY